VFWSGPFEEEKRDVYPASTEWLSWESVVYLLLGEEYSISPLRYFEPQLVYEEVESPPGTRRGRPSLSNGPFLCAPYCTAGSVVELYV
jgi:hypothetical protein